MKTAVHILGLLLWMAVSAQASQSLISGEKLKAQLKSLGDDGLGIAKMQTLVDESSFTKTSLNGEKALKELSEAMERKLGDISLAVADLKQVIEEEFDNFDDTGGGIPQCCNFDDTDAEGSEKFQAEVDSSTTCYVKSQDAIEHPKIPSSSKVLEILKENNNVPSGTWQHIGTEEGIWVTYPAHHQEGCNEYDPRYRPWYVETAAPVAKDLVICLDTSDSMRKDDKLANAVKAIDTLMSTLNPSDRVGLVTFSDTAVTPEGPASESCYHNELAYAVPENKRYLIDYLERQNPGGSTNYIVALERAFQMLKENENSGIHSRRKPRRKVLLFFTDGKPQTQTSEAILNRTRTLNAQQNNQVTILTYGFGADLDDESKDLLEKMTLVHEPNREVYRGQFRYIENMNYLRHELGTFYNAFADADEMSVPQATAPYIDFNTKTLTVSMCLPIYSRGTNTRTLRGVACMDFRPQEITSDIKYFAGGEMSYGFIINGDGRVVLHPLVPTAQGDYTADPITLYIEDVETEPRVKEIIESMKKGGSGALYNIARNTLLATGDSLYEGVDKLKVNASYFWQKVPKTNFSICLVVMSSDKTVTIDTKVNLRNFVYHRLDLLTDELAVKQCVNYDRLSTKEHSVVKLTAEAFKEPYVYLNSNETSQTVKRYRKRIFGDLPDNTFKDGVAETVAITEQIEPFWTKAHGYYHGNTVWRYFCTYVGVCRIYPGVAINQQWDHTKRAWYTRSVANRNNYVLSTPYIDGWGAGLVLTLSHSIYIGTKHGHLTNDPLLGVIAMDFKLHFVKGLIQDLFPACWENGNSCFLLEKSGYLVYHDDFLRKQEPDDAEVPLVEYVHVTVKETAVASDLIERGYLTRRQCRNLEDKREYHTWQLHIQTGIHDNWDEELKYQIEQVPFTNLFLVIKAAFLSTLQCRCHVDGKATGRCFNTDGKKCECPCYTLAHYLSCQNKYEKADDDVELCFPNQPAATTESPVVNENKIVQSLPVCFQPTCEGRGTDWECKKYAEVCSWCVVNSSETRERCRIHDECWAGSSAAGEPAKDGTVVAVATSVCLAVFLLALILGIVFVLRKKGIIGFGKKTATPGRTTDQPRNSFSDSAMSVGSMDSDSQMILYRPTPPYMRADTGRTSNTNTADPPSNGPPRRPTGTGEGDDFHPPGAPPTSPNQRRQGVLVYEPGSRSPFSAGQPVTGSPNRPRWFLNRGFEEENSSESTDNSGVPHRRPYEQPLPVAPLPPPVYQPLSPEAHRATPTIPISANV